MKRTDGSISQRVSTLIKDGSIGKHKYTVPVAGVVINVYYPEDDKNVGKTGIECDVITYAKPYKARLWLKNVPVVQQGGYDNVNLWIPNPTTQDISGKSLKLFADNIDDAFKISRLEDLDGDHVIIDFIDGNVAMPIIRGCLPHPNPKVKPSKTSGNKRLLRHNGVDLAIDKDGNVSIDIANQTSATVEVKNGSETLFKIQNGSGTLYDAVLADKLIAELNKIKLHTHQESTGGQTLTPTQIADWNFDAARSKAVKLK